MGENYFPFNNRMTIVTEAEAALNFQLGRVAPSRCPSS
jgi:hypothetical protein